MVENGGGGSEFAAPIARKVLDYYLRDYESASELEMRAELVSKSVQQPSLR